MDNDIRLICLDVDNTLVDSFKNIPQANIQWRAAISPTTRAISWQQES